MRCWVVATGTLKPLPYQHFLWALKCLHCFSVQGGGGDPIHVQIHEPFLFPKIDFYHGSLLPAHMHLEM